MKLLIVASTALLLTLTGSLALTSTVVYLHVVDQLEMKSDCEAEMPRNAHCIAGYFPMEIKEYYSTNDIEVPKEEK